jgi:hypothetical protein
MSCSKTFELFTKDMNVAGRRTEFLRPLFCFIIVFPIRDWPGS